MFFLERYFISLQGIVLKQGQPYCIFKIEETISKPLTQIRYIPEGNQRKTRRKPGKSGGNLGESRGKPGGNQKETKGKPG